MWHSYYIWANVSASHLKTWDSSLMWFGAICQILLRQHSDTRVSYVFSGNVSDWWQTGESFIPEWHQKTLPSSQLTDAFIWCTATPVLLHDVITSYCHWEKGHFSHDPSVTHCFPADAWVQILTLLSETSASQYNELYLIMLYTSRGTNKSSQLYIFSNPMHEDANTDN